jgi:apolipoprotein N-acyltransferase
VGDRANTLAGDGDQASRGLGAASPHEPDRGPEVDPPVGAPEAATRPRAGRRGLLARIGWAVAFAGLMVASFPFRADELRFDVGWIVGWVALVPFALGVRGLGARAAFTWATAAGTLAYAGVLYWIFVVVHVHGHAPAPVAVAAVIALAFYVGLHIGAAGALVAALEPYAGPARFLVLPAAWVVTEQLRTFDLATGFPWAFLGYAPHRDGPILELASFGGVFGLSFLLAAVASVLSRRRFVLALGLVVVAHVTGFAWRVTSVQQLPDGEASSLVGVVQANIPQEQKWDRSLAQEAFEAHLETSRLAALAGRVDLIVWPEASVPVVLQWQPEYSEAILELARETGATLLVGATAVEPDGPNAWRYFNSLFVVTPQDGYVDRYDKSRLVPFGEYVPFRAVLGALSGLATGLAAGDVTPGPGPRVILLDGPDQRHALAPLICYEVIYPDLVRDAVRQGARILLNVTNDAWYGRTSAPHQFMAIAATRSAEHGVPMLRSANTGVSAIVDAGGAVLGETPIFERHALRGRVPGSREGATLYTRFGDWIVWASWCLLIAIGGVRLVGRGNRTAQGAAGQASPAR